RDSGTFQLHRKADNQEAAQNNRLAHLILTPHHLRKKRYFSATYNTSVGINNENNLANTNISTGSSLSILFQNRRQDALIQFLFLGQSDRVVVAASIDVFTEPVLDLVRDIETKVHVGSLLGFTGTFESIVLVRRTRNPVNIV